MTTSFITQHRAALNAALLVQKEIDALNMRPDAILDPIAVEAIKLPKDDIAEVVKELPPGFHRSELNTRYFQLEEEEHARAEDTPGM